MKSITKYFNEERDPASLQTMLHAFASFHKKQDRITSQQKTLEIVNQLQILEVLRINPDKLI